MAACEECWADAVLASRTLGGSQVDHYQRLLAERGEHGCVPAAVPRAEVGPQAAALEALREWHLRQHQLREDPWDTEARCAAADATETLWEAADALLRDEAT